jgi:hypothetical protein
MVRARLVSHRADVSCGSKCEELSVSKSSRLCPPLSGPHLTILYFFAAFRLAAGGASPALHQISTLPLGSFSDRSMNTDIGLVFRK